MTIGVTRIYRGLPNDHRNDTYSCIGASTMVIGVTRSIGASPMGHTSDTFYRGLSNGSLE